MHDKLTKNPNIYQPKKKKKKKRKKNYMLITPCMSYLLLILA